MAAGDKDRTFWAELEARHGSESLPAEEAPLSPLEGEEAREGARSDPAALANQRFVDSVRKLAEVADRLGPDSDFLDLLKTLLQRAMETTEAEAGSVLALDEDTGELVFVLSEGHTANEDLKWHRLAKGKGIAGWAATHRRATVVNDAPTDERFYAGIDAELKFKTETLLAAPIIGGNRVLGVVEVLNKREGLFFTKAEVTLVELMSRFAGEMLYSRLKEQRDAGGNT